MFRYFFTRTTRVASAVPSMDRQQRTIPRLTGAELADIIKSDKKPWQDYLVVDVRDSDWKGGNIKGSHHLPSLKFQSGVDELVSKTKNVPMVIFHCKFSQERGPVAAGIYDTKRSLRDEEEYKKQEVYVLTGGFNTFAATYKNDPLLVENWDENVVIW